MRVLGIDYGDARIGLAMSDINMMLASPLETYQAKSMRTSIDYISALVKEKQVELIVIGMPLNMDGTKGERADKTESFGSVLEKVSGVKVEYKDERLSTVSAEKTLISNGMRRDKRKEVIDTLSAQIILQGYLDRKRNNF